MRNKGLIALTSVLIILILAWVPTSASNRIASDSVSLQGRINLITDNAWLIGSTWVSVNSATEIVGNPEVGDMARVEAEMLSGRFLALRIEVIQPGGEETVTIEGAISRIKDRKWRVGDFTVVLDENTTIAGMTPSVGLFASVEGIQQSSFSILARTIFVFSPDSIFPIGGLVVGLSNGAVRLLAAENITTTAAIPITATVDAGTLVDEHAGVLTTGSWVEGRLENLDHGLHAVRLSVYTPPEVTLCGTLTPFGEGNKADLWKVDGRIIRVSPTAEVAGTPVQGAPAYVHGALLNDGSIWVKEIYMVEVSTFSGVLSVVGTGEYPQRWVLKVYDPASGSARRIPFQVTEYTFFDTTWGPLQVGQNAQITVIPGEDGTWLALSVVTLPSTE